MNKEIFKKLLYIVLPLIILILIILFLSKNINQNKNITNGLHTIVGLDTTDDEKTLGYTDARKIIQSPNGNFYAAYRKKNQSSKGEYMIYVTKSVDQGKSWQICNNGEAISKNVGFFDQRVPSITSDDQNNIHVVWYGRDSIKIGKNQREIKYSSSSSDCKKWSSWRNIAPIDGYDGQDLWQEHPVILFGNNNLYVVWEGKDSKNKKNQQIKFIRSNDGGKAWTLVKNIYTTPANTQSRPSLIIRKNGTLLVYAYTAFNIPKGFQQIQISVSNDNGENWSEWRNISDTNDDARHVSAVSDNSGNIYFAWRQIQNNKAQIFWTTLREEEISSAKPIYQKGNSNQFFPSLGLIGDKIILAYTQTDNFDGLPKEEIHLPGTSYVLEKDDKDKWKEIDKITGISLVLAPLNTADNINGVFLQVEDDHYKINFFQKSLDR